MSLIIAKLTLLLTFGVGESQLPACVIFVHDDPAFLASAASAIQRSGYTVAAFSDPMQALSTLEKAKSAELLVTRAEFSRGKPNGVSLALMARVRRPGIKVLFMGRPEHDEHTRGLGDLLPADASVADVVQAAQRRLDRALS